MKKILAITLICFLGATSLTSATELEQSMKRLSNAYKRLTADLKQPVEASKADYLALAATMKTEVQTSRALVPKKVAGMPQDQQAAPIADYQKSLDDLAATIDVLSQDITASNWADANKQIATLKQQMIDGHKKFRKPEHHDAPAPTAASTNAAPAAPAPPQ
jgi:hypothetical protein